MRRYPSQLIHSKAPEPTPIFQHLIDVGADLLVRDGRGNTVLHYLANAGLCDLYHADAQRRWLRRFLTLPIDVNARNDNGISALEVLLLDAKESAWRDVGHSGNDKTPLDVEAIYVEVLGLFHDAGVRWTELGPGGQALLHIVAKQELYSGPFMVAYLLQKGVDPNVRDQEGQSALDLVRAMLAVAEFFAETKIAEILEGVTHEIPM